LLLPTLKTWLVGAVSLKDGSLAFAAVSFNSDTSLYVLSILSPPTIQPPVVIVPKGFTIIKLGLAFNPWPTVVAEPVPVPY
jgi:hypothetical protein